MNAKKQCARCDEPVETIDNILGSSFWGLIQKRTTISTVETLRVAATTIRHKPSTVLRSDEEQTLCDPCWGLLVGKFLQGREVPALNHEHQWKQMKNELLDRCELCYKTRITDRTEDGGA